MSSAISTFFNEERMPFSFEGKRLKKSGFKFAQPIFEYNYIQIIK